MHDHGQIALAGDAQVPLETVDLSVEVRIASGLKLEQVQARFADCEHCSMLKCGEHLFTLAAGTVHCKRMDTGARPYVIMGVRDGKHVAEFSGLCAYAKKTTDAFGARIDER